MPTSSLQRHFEHRHLNTWGDDGAKGTATLARRVDRLAADLLGEGLPDVVTLVEVRDDQVPLWRARLEPAGLAVVLAGAGNLVAVPAGSEVRKAQNKYLPSGLQGAGRREALGMVRARVNGHWEHLFVSHLEFRDGPRFDLVRVKQGAWIARQAEAWSVTFGRSAWRSHTTIGIDENSQAWVRDRAFAPAGLVVALKSGVDAIYGNRTTVATRTIRTASDHPILAVVYGKNVDAPLHDT